MNYERVLFLSFFFFCIHIISAQQDYKGQILDSETKEPIPYVNIGVFGKGIGTVSDEEGRFNLFIDKSKLSTSDVIQFSSIGYKTLKKIVSGLQYVSNEYPKILMQEESVVLDEVIVTNRGAFEVSDVVGYQNYGEKTFGYWKDNIALGGELATKIKVKKGVRRLNTLFFEVFANPSDSVLVRVNIYETGKSRTTVGKKLNSSNKNILYTIRPGTRLAVVDLTPYSIYIKDDFFVSLELLKVYGDKPIGLVIAASADKNTYSLGKYASLDKWEQLNHSAMAYHLNTTYFSDSKRAESKVAKAQKSKKNISGFIFSSRRPLRNIKVTNLTTNQETFSNEKGRYQILGEKDDVISFEGKGYKKMTVKLLAKTTVNMNLLRN
ncbi:carboxypeptidase-like regulatory domain-containing protein [Maribacter sp. 2308TA10-17]|uniref:carboxypeptidase-like regulatory domain-containing protein n=1 Tax=Maribacter sp. 2308TA10-17 TaxID=3386276 RepID=UPI0039BC50C5